MKNQKLETYLRNKVLKHSDFAINVVAFFRVLRTKINKAQWGYGEWMKTYKPHNDFCADRYGHIFF